MESTQSRSSAALLDLLLASTQVGKQYEIRDPIHNFVRLTADEVRAINSRPFQRLRHVHQLALTYLVYPGATHRRFEHSLGVLELAGRVFDVLTAEHNRDGSIDFPDALALAGWRQHVRLGALFHDLGHLPFSHAAEEQLLPDGKHHEWLTVEVLRSDEMREILGSMMPPVDVDKVARIAIGPEKWARWFGQTTDYSEWELLMTEIVTGDAFGADRIDYLLRDSHHAGVAYGRFDHYRLIDTLRILPHPKLERPMIGIQHGGIHAAEALQLARQFMFLQLYYHHARIAYDIHLSEFMIQWLTQYPIDVEGHLKVTDNEVLAAISTVALDQTAPGHDAAFRIARRAHFRRVYSRNAMDQRLRVDAVGRVAAALQMEFGPEEVRSRSVPPKQQAIDFPVRLDSGEISTSVAESSIYADFKPAAVGFVFVSPEKRKDAEKYLSTRKKQILSEQLELDL